MQSVARVKKSVECWYQQVARIVSKFVNKRDLWLKISGQTDAGGGDECVGRLQQKHQRRSVVLAPVEVHDNVGHHQSRVADFNAAVEEVEREEEQRDLDTKRDDFVRRCRGYYVTLAL